MPANQSRHIFIKKKKPRFNYKRCQETEIWTEYIIDARGIARRNIFGIYFRMRAQGKKYCLFNIFHVDRNNYYFRYNCANVISLAHIGGPPRNSENTISPDFTNRRHRVNVTIAVDRSISIRRSTRSASREHIYSIKSVHSARTRHARF